MTLEHIQFNRLTSFIISSLAYYMAGLVGLELAIPPGFASAVWPAAGVALALAILLPTTPVVMGTFVASFLLNSQLVSDASGAFTWPHLVVPFLIALGAALQLIAGYVLFRHYLKQNIISDVPHTIIRFYMIVVPVGCLVSASVGTAALYMNQVISSNAVMFSWSTWWLGDCIGVLLFTPMLMIIFANKAYFKFSRRLQVVIPTTLIFTSTSVLFFWSINNTYDNVERELDITAKRYSHEIEERLELSTSKLQSYQAFFQGSNYISFKEYEAYSETLLGSDNTLYSVGWTEVTRHKDRARVIKSIVDQGFDDFEFKVPSSSGMVTVRDKDAYYPVLYIYPYGRNKRALGLDLSELPGRLDLLKKIEATGKGRVTSPITLVQEKEDEKSIIIYLPVWQKYPNDEVLRGYVSGVYRASGLLGAVLTDAQKNNLGISVTDITYKGDPKVLIERVVPTHSYIPSKNYEIQFQGSRYQVKITPGADYQANQSDWVSWVILICGFVISALMQAFILMMSGAIEHTNRMVELKTKQLTLSMEKAESASQAKSMFLANMNHELRTPLNAIIGLVNLCLKTALSHKQSSYLYQAKLATHTLMSLINQSLDYAKIESGKLELEHIAFDLSEVIQKIHAVFNMQALQKGIEFKLLIDGDIHRYFMGDPLRIEQVLLNLCSNALKFTDSGTVSVSVFSKSMSNNQAEIMIKIQDSGIGISKEQQAHLFQSFQQADNTTTRKYGGTGLGLAISKQLVELMNGSIVINSDIGKGCEFVICLPLEKSQQADMFNSQTIASYQPETEHVNAVTAGDPSSLEGLNILLVEDIEINRMIATELLEGHGANVTQAFDGQQALDTVKTDTRFDVVLMDIQMPVMDGLEATQAIRAIPEFADLPILAMTANAMNEDIDHCYGVGMNGHIAKPIDENNMISTILSVLSSSSPPS
jgi:signal transduction histidine kinase/CheY-like chemotaxis protein/integral membrane sensor domain MASE1